MNCKGILLGSLLCVAGVARADIQDHTIWLQPGQCIVVSNQQICAQRSDHPSDKPTAKKERPNREVHTCKNGVKDETDPNLKGWAHVVVVMNADGKKVSEEVIKTYGPVGQQECEAEIKTLKSQM